MTLRSVPACFAMTLMGFARTIASMSVPCCLVTLVACSTSEETPTVAGKSPPLAADISTAIVCDYAARCGEVSVSCADCAGSDCGGCQAEHLLVTYDACADEVGEQLGEGFACAELSDEDERLIVACLAARPSLACVSADEAEAWANGGDGPDPRKLSPACQRLEDLRWGCGG